MEHVIILGAVILALLSAAAIVAAAVFALGLIGRAVLAHFQPSDGARNAKGKS